MWVRLKANVGKAVNLNMKKKPMFKCAHHHNAERESPQRCTTLLMTTNQEMRS